MCPVHDKWQVELPCTCSPERKWARDKMLQENLEKIASFTPTAPGDKQDG